MSRRKGASGGKGGKDGLGEEDFHLWKAFTRDITPLFPAADENMEKPLPPEPARSKTKSAPPPAPIPLQPAASPPRSAELDLRTELRLRRGKMPIEGRLDLHGCTQEKAHRLLEAFLLSSHAGGKRCVLVITGKGKTSSQRSDAGEPVVGVLRRKLPQWLGMPPLNGIVLKAQPAAPKDGGAGAWYIYLRRQREMNF